MMKYENARDVLPQELFEEVQKYASGKLLYFPVAGQRCLWGTKSGNRFRNEQRNQEIRELYRNGFSHDQLSERYYLAPESIRNIIYSKKGTKMNLDEIFKLYEDAPPLAMEKTFGIDEVKEWGRVLLPGGLPGDLFRPKTQGVYPSISVYHHRTHRGAESDGRGVCSCRVRCLPHCAESIRHSFVCRLF